MERYSMFLGRKNQYYENDYTTKCNIQIKCDPYQIMDGIFHRTRTKNFTIHMETRKTSSSQSSLYVEHFLKSLYWIYYNIASILCFGFFGCKACGISLSTDWTCTTWIGRQSLKHWITRELLHAVFITLVYNSWVIINYTSVNSYMYLVSL